MSNADDDQWDRIGQFYVSKKILKIPQIIDEFLGYFEKHYYLSISCIKYFWASFIKVRETFHSNIWPH